MTAPDLFDVICTLDDAAAELDRLDFTEEAHELTDLSDRLKSCIVLRLKTDEPGEAR